MKTTNSVSKGALYRYGVASNIRELQQLENKNVTVLMYDTGMDIEVVACEKMWDLPHHASKIRTFSNSSDQSKFMLLQVEIVNPIILPYELVGSQEVFVIYDEWDFCRFTNTALAGRGIEQIFGTYVDADIEKDFLVMIGNETSVRTLNTILTRIDNLMGD